MPGPAAILNGLRREHAHMLGGSIWLLAATLVVSLGSFIFWLLVTQRVPADDVGRAAALFSASLFVCYLTSLGLPIAVSRYASDRTQGSATLFAWSLVLTIGVVARGCGRVRRARSGLDPGRSRHLASRFRLARGVPAGRGPVDRRARGRAADGAAALVPGVFPVSPDRRPPPPFFALGARDAGPRSTCMWSPWAASRSPVSLSSCHWRAAVGSGCVRSRARKARAQFAGVNYLGQLAVQAPFFAVPFVVLVQVDAVENAHFYLSWGVMSVVYISVQMIGQALLVEGGRGGADHRRQAAVALGAGLAVAVSATVLSLGLGPLLAGLYGPAYGPIATLLPLLVAGTIPFAVTMAAHHGEDPRALLLHDRGGRGLRGRACSSRRRSSPRATARWAPPGAGRWATRSPRCSRSSPRCPFGLRPSRRWSDRESSRKGAAAAGGENIASGGEL